ncbi:MAG TPA: hypothetical protein ENK18_27085 [Deltaproteobacteria bacterium]|nr:hypothetical protein [Deltaproteobacteria bacterium]
MRATVGIVWIVGLGAGCHNSCQALCLRMASYAEECGFVVSDAELDQCLSDLSSPDRQTRQTCGDFGSPDTLRSEWTCEALGSYWGDGATDDAR